MSNPLFQEVVEATGLSPKIAPFVVRRVCTSIGFPATSMTPAQLTSSLGALAAAIRVYKPKEEADQAVARLQRLASEFGGSVDRVGTL